MRRALLLAPVLLLLLGAPAAADDELEIDERLVEAGFDEAYTTSQYTDDGARVIVDFSSDSDSREAYEQEAREAAQLVWEHLELQVQAVDVAPTYGVEWVEPLPPTVSFTRAELEREFGARPARLDEADPGDAFAEGFEEGFEDLEAGWFAIGVLPLVLPMLLGALAGGAVGAVLGGVAGYVLGRRSGAPAPGSAPWGPAAPGWGPAGGWGAAPWPPHPAPSQPPPGGTP